MPAATVSAPLQEPSPLTDRLGDVKPVTKVPDGVSNCNRTDVAPGHGSIDCTVTCPPSGMVVGVTLNVPLVTVKDSDA